jgi:hypothetical protein
VLTCKGCDSSKNFALVTAPNGTTHCGKRWRRRRTHVCALQLPGRWVALKLTAGTRIASLQQQQQQLCCCPCVSNIHSSCQPSPGRCAHNRQHNQTATVSLTSSATVFTNALSPLCRLQGALWCSAARFKARRQLSDCLCLG